LKGFEIGANAVLRNIFFDFNKDDLRSESEVELNKLYLILSQNANMVIEIGGHTDNIGNSNFNQKLSENRARKVAEYLTSKGINANRLHPKGYGPGKPISTNDTEEGRQTNRRIDYTILKL
jgi:OOP family OmpA-OmpF porin